MPDDLKIDLSHWKHVRHNYKIKEVAGVGAYGTVLVGKHRESGTHVAIKMIPVEADKTYRLKQVL